MAGFKKQICRLIALVMTLSVVFIAQSQSRDERIESARVIDGELSIHVSIPRGRVIENATLTIGGETIELKTSPVPLDTTSWLIIDRSESVINTASAISNNLDRFVQAQMLNGGRVGIIFYDVTPQIYHPSSVFADIQTWLSGYSGRANTVGCVGDALATLAGIPNTHDRSQRVLLITGRLQRQGLCNEQGVLSVQSPVDVIVVADIVDDFYRDVTERSGGTLLRANVQTVGNRINEISAIWSNSSYLLNSSYAGTSRQGRLNLVLSDGREVGLQVDLFIEESEEIVSPVVSLTTLDDPNAVPTQEVIIQSPQPSPEPTLAPVVEEVVEEIHTLIPTMVVEPTIEQLIIELPTIELPTQEVAVIPAIIPTETIDINPTEDIQIAIVREQPLSEEPSQIDEQQDSIVLEQEQSVTEIPIIPLDSDDTPSFNPIPWEIVWGLIPLVILIVVALILLNLRQSKPKSKPNLASYYTPDDAYAGTMLQGFTEIEEVDTYPARDELDISEIVEIDNAFDYTEIVDDEDLFDRTEIVTDDELLDQKRILADLLLDSTGEKYPISTPITVLGRLNTCDIVIEDKKISREHLCFYEKDEQLWVWVKSQNPILINNELVRERQQLQIGDKLRLAPNLDAVILAHGEDGE